MGRGRDAEAVPVTGLVLKVSPMLRMAPPPWGRLSWGGFIAAKVARGARVPVTVEGVAATATVEGVVPAPGGSLYTVNALVPNREGTLLSGGSARLMVGTGTRQALLVPGSALRREGDLVGVTVTSGGTTTTRWIRTGTTVGDRVEVLAGLAAGDTVRVPSGAANGAANGAAKE